MAFVSVVHVSQKELLVFGCIRKWKSVLQIPFEITDICDSFFGEYFRILPFDLNNANCLNSSTNICLSKNNKCLKTATTWADPEYRWIFVDTIPISTGKRCWRIKIQNNYNNGKLFCGIVPLKYRANFSFKGKVCWNDDDLPYYGINNYLIQYGKNAVITKTFEKKDFTFFPFANCEMDMYLNTNKGQLKFCIVGRLNDNVEVKINGLPKTQNQQWIPMLCMRYSVRECTIQTAIIDTDNYGQNDFFRQWES
eukprot:44205_1